LTSNYHAWALGGFAKGFTPPPTKAKKLTLQVYRPRNEIKLITCRYMQKTQEFSLSPRMLTMSIELKGQRWLPKNLGRFLNVFIHTVFKSNECPNKKPCMHFGLHLRFFSRWNRSSWSVPNFAADSSEPSCAGHPPHTSLFQFVGRVSRFVRQQTRVWNHWIRHRFFGIRETTVAQSRFQNRNSHEILETMTN